MDPFSDAKLLSSPIFKLTIDIATETPNPSSQVRTRAKASAPPSTETYLIHKDLLASLSPELMKHVNNDMREGITGSMHLKEVDKETLESFLMWVYKGDYADTTAHMEADKIDTIRVASLIQHAKVYVFAERFNIAGLKRKLYSKIVEMLQEVDRVAGLDIARVVKALLDMLHVCFENLPLAHTPEVFLQEEKPENVLCIVCGMEFPNNSQRLKHLRIAGHYRSQEEAEDTASTRKLIRFLYHYIAWNLPVLRPHQGFQILLERHPECAVALVLSMCGPSAQSPWGSVRQRERPNRVEKPSQASEKQRPSTMSALHTSTITGNATAARQRTSFATDNTVTNPSINNTSYRCSS